MDVDEDPTSYLNYLNDGDTPNTFLLGDNEVMLEPMFMDVVSDWPTEVSNNETLQESKQKAPLIITEENCTLITSTNTKTTGNSHSDQKTNSQNNQKVDVEIDSVETCTIIAENGTEQTILVDKNFGVISSNHPQPNKCTTNKFVSNSNPENIQKNNFAKKIDKHNVGKRHEVINIIENQIIKPSKQKFCDQNSIQSNTIESAQKNETTTQNLKNFVVDIQNIKSNFQDTEAKFQDINSTQLEFQITDGTNLLLKNTEPQFQSIESQYKNIESECLNGEQDYQSNKNAHLINQNNASPDSNYQNIEYNTVYQNSENPDSVYKNIDPVGDPECEIQPDSTTYINYDPIVKEKENGLREIYLTEKDIFNDAKVIQLLNTDGSVITIDKALFNSIDVYNDHKSVLKPIEVTNNVTENKPPEIKDFFTTVMARKCKICDFLVEHNDEILAHILEKHFYKLNVCEEIKKSPETTKGKAKMIHIESNSEESPKSSKSLEHECDLCDITFNSEELLKKHHTTVHLEELQPKQTQGQKLKTILNQLLQLQIKALKKYRCPIKGCLGFFPTEELRSKHEKMHLQGHKNHFKCPECSEKFFLWRIAKTHMLKMHQQSFGLFVCPICNRFKTYSACFLKTHMNTHKENEISFVCQICDQGFTTYSKMKNHELQHKDLDSTFNFLQKCQVCSRSFYSQKNLKNHIRSVHQDYRPYVCKICGHKTTRKHMLNLHLRQHTGAKPYKCLYCEFTTGDHNCLRRHSMTHIQSAKQYMCPHCGFTCIQTVALKRHIAAKHPNKEGIYRCDKCPFSFINMLTYEAHQQSHQLGNLQKPREVIEVAIRVPERDKTDTDEDTQNPFFEEPLEEQPIDTGGITIPAGCQNIAGSDNNLSSQDNVAVCQNNVGFRLPDLPILDICEDTMANR